MMVQSTPLIILKAALIINILSHCTAENVYCVTPTATSCSSCPHNTHCATLSEYAREAQRYFTSNTTMVFLPGDHALDTNVTVNNIASLTMRGESTTSSKATVVCSGLVGLSFTSMLGLKIDSLAFTACSRKYAVDVTAYILPGPLANNHVALLLQSTQYAELSNCSFHDNLGTALVVNNTNITLSGNNFTHNHPLCGGVIMAAGAIIVLNSNLTFTENTTFFDNYVTCSAPLYQFSAYDWVAGNGGAIYTSGYAVLSFNGTSNFINNSAGHSGAGGAIYTSENTVISFSGTSNFINNSAEGGGAIFSFGNTVIRFNGINNFINNSADLDGGAIFTLGNSVLNFNGTSNFINNSAGHTGGGGAISTSDSTVLRFSGTSNFINNSAAWSGGAIITLDNTMLSFSGINNFINNSATYYPNGSAGAILTYDNTFLSFIGINNFVNNSAGYGGAISSEDNTVLSFNGTNNFTNNSAKGGGAIYTSDNTVLSFSGTNNFVNNSAEGGGAIFSNDNTVISFNGTNNLIYNSATFCGGGGGAISTYDSVVLSFSGTSNFINNSACHSGGAIFTDNTVINFSGTSNFINNWISGGHAVGHSGGGGAISVYAHTELIFNGTSNFINNSATRGGAIFTDNTVLNFSGISNFINNSADSGGGAIYTNTNSALTFNETIYFINNGYDGGIPTQYVYTNGGGVYMGFKSTISILPHTTVYWENNHATRGGAIYVHDASPISYCSQVAPYVPKEECFFQLPAQNLSNGIDVKLVFKNNSADVAGSVLYGGAIDNCKLTGLDSHNSGKVFDMMVYNNDTDYNTTSNISSNPLHIFPCEHKHPDFTYPWYKVPHIVYPGEMFQVSVVAVGQRNGTIPSTVLSGINKNFNPGDSLDSQYLQRKADDTCTTLNYIVCSLSENVIIDLHADGTPCDDTTLSISVNLNQSCPPGLSISEPQKSCVCGSRLAQYNLQCNITNGLVQITRDSSKQLWVGYDSQSHEVILHPLCPFDYCVSHTTVVFPFNNTDMQCAYNRSDLLCGRCKKGYSLVLGTSQCKKCTNKHLAFIVPFAVMGVALVLLLLVCKLTVATGTLSGLVFYANIVGVNRTIFLPVKSTDAFSVFIAWLNLDFGVDTCFFDGMDAYSKTWLQFVFPVYIWILVGIIILVSNYSHRFANMLGNNPVSVLATLILLSYAKILRTLIAVFYVTYLEYPTYNRSVWLYDANIDYLSGKHIPLFLVAVLIFFFLFLPYTFLLLFGQWLQAISHLRLFTWVNSARLKPFMDSYHAPYKAKHRYWPGLLLVLRFVLLLVFALNPQQDLSINLLAILVGTGLLHFRAWVSGGVYMNWCLDALEGSFALNLITLVGATFYVNHSGGNQLAAGYTSVSIAFATFSGILVYQLVNVTGIAQYLKRKCTAVAIRDQAEAEVEPLNDGSLPDRLINPEEYEPPFHTPQGHTAAAGANETQRRLFPAYTYGSIN